MLLAHRSAPDRCAKTDQCPGPPTQVHFSLRSSLPVRSQSSHLRPCFPCRQRPGRRPPWRPGWGRRPGCTRQMPWPVTAWCRNSPRSCTCFLPRRGFCYPYPALLRGLSLEEEPFLLRNCFFFAVEKTYFKNYAPPLRQPCPEGAGAYAMPPYYLCRGAVMSTDNTTLSLAGGCHKRAGGFRQGLP